MSRTALAALCAVLLVGGCAGPPEQPEPQPAPPTESTTATVPSEPKGLAPSEPTEIRIPEIGVRSSLIPLGLNADGTVEVPPVSAPMQAGWYRNAPTPGEVGPAVVLGHVDGNAQPGIFLRLHELKPGNAIEVSRMDGTIARFLVRQVNQVAKDQFPTEAVYGDTAGPELRLITCGGSFDSGARSYRDNIIVYATLS